MPPVGRAPLIDAAWHELSAGGRVVLEGPAGIGKSTVLHAVVALARSQGWQVLTCAPTESESALPLAALADLLAPLAYVAPRLAAPQRAAASAIFLTGMPTPDESGVDERAIAAATRALLLQAATGPTPVLVAIDDVPWLDPASDAALRFALRRLDVPLLAAVRSGDRAQTPLDLDEPGRREVRHLRVGPLEPAEIRALVGDRFGDVLPLPLVNRIAHEAGGHPLVGVELARAVLRAPRLPLPTDPLPAAGGSAMDLARRAVAALPPPTRAALSLASLLSSPSVEDLVAAGVSIDDVQPARDAGLVELDRGRMVFAHATYAAAARDLVDTADRERHHRLLAAAVTDPDERARQLAAGTFAPDAWAADELEASASRQLARGLIAVAGDLFLRAAELTPVDPPGPQDARLARACECAFEAGDHDTAAALARRLERAATPEGRAEGAMHLASLAWWDGDVDVRTAYEIASAGLQGLSDDTPQYGRLQLHLSVFAPTSAAAIEHGRAAVDALRRVWEVDESVAAEFAGAVFGLFGAEVLAGHAPRLDLLAEGLAVEDGPSPTCGEVPAIYWSGVDEADRARARIDDLQRSAAASGSEVWQMQLANQLAAIELLADRYDAADEALAVSLAAARAIGTGTGQQEWLRGMIALRRGDLDTAETRATGTVEGGGSYSERVHRHLAGLVAHARGEHEAAADAFAVVAGLMDRDEIRETPAARFEPDWVESLVHLGDLRRAGEVVERLEERHRRSPRPWTALASARCRVLLDPGDDTALKSALETVAGTPRDVVPWEQGRTLLVVGRAHAAMGRSDLAAEPLAAALATFERIGAGWWATEARNSATGTARSDPEEIRRALRQFHRPADLATSSLATGVGVEARARSVRELIERATDECFGEAEGERLLRDVVRAAYLQADGGHTRAMRSLNLSRTTYYRRLAEATDRLVSHLGA